MREENKKMLSLLLLFLTWKGFVSQIKYNNY